MKVFAVKVPSVSAVTVICRSHAEALEHIGAALDAEDRGEVTIEIKDMPEEAVDALGEFEGY